MNQTKNIYQKLQEARVTLQDLNLKPSGKNTYSNYIYYELKDFLPAVNRICNDLKLFTKFSLVQKGGEKEMGIVRVTNSDAPDEYIDFALPTAEVEIGKKKDGTGGAEPIQNMGGKSTYMRRYCYMNAFEIAEPDIVERINADLTKEISDKDLEKIEAAKTVEELTKLFNEMQNRYKIEIIKDKFSEKRIKLEQDSNEGA